MRACGAATILLALAGCGGPGYANFHNNTAAISTTPTPNNGNFVDEQDSVSASGGAATVTVSATYDGTLTTGDASPFVYPFTVTLDGAPYTPDSNFSFTATTVDTTPPAFFGELNLVFRSLGVGSHTVVVHFGNLPNFTGAPLADETIPVTISANG